MSKSRRQWHIVCASPDNPCSSAISRKASLASGSTTTTRPTYCSAATVPPKSEAPWPLRYYQAIGNHVRRVKNHPTSGTLLVRRRRRRHRRPESGASCAGSLTPRASPDNLARLEAPSGTVRRPGATDFLCVIVRLCSPADSSPGPIECSKSPKLATCIASELSFVRGHLA